MRLPGWFPTVRAPWNPAYRDTWNAMSKEEKQWSCFFDICLIILVVTAVMALSGCQRAPDASRAREGTTERPVPQSAASDTMQRRYTLLVDTETGCEYWQGKFGSYNMPPTPRWAWGGSGAYVKGCK